jgi:hypothetical protein
MVLMTALKVAEAEAFRSFPQSLEKNVGIIPYN